MAVTFFIPGPLRPFTDGRSVVVIECPMPATMDDALEVLWREWPGVRTRMANERREIREHINVFVGNEDVRYTGGLKTVVPDGAEVTILPSVSGGLV